MQNLLINNGDNKVHHERKAVINMDHCTFPNPCEDSWWIEKIQLLNSNKDEITAGGWLSAPVINSGQFILEKQFSSTFKGSGYQDVGYGLVMNFYIEKERFIQILHDSSGHWLTISNVGTEKPHIMWIYDSLYSSCSLNVQQQIACLLNTDMPNITLEFVTVHKQHGSDDCGLFSLALQQLSAIISSREIMYSTSLPPYILSGK